MKIVCMPNLISLNVCVVLTLNKLLYERDRVCKRNMYRAHIILISCFSIGRRYADTLQHRLKAWSHVRQDYDTISFSTGAKIKDLGWP